MVTHVIKSGNTSKPLGHLFTPYIYMMKFKGIIEFIKIDLLLFRYSIRKCLLKSIGIDNK